MPSNNSIKDYWAKPLASNKINIAMHAKDKEQFLELEEFLRSTLMNKDFFHIELM